MSQWADNTDRLNQWAESRRRFSVFVFVFVCVCVCSSQGENGEDVREKMFPGFQGVCCRE